MNLEAKPHNAESAYELDGQLLHQSVFNLEWLDNPKVVLDVGAWDFGDSIRIKQRFPDCRVVAFELDYDNHDKFSPFALSKGIEAKNIGVSSKNEFIRYFKARHTHGDNAQSSLLKPNDKYKDLYGNIVSHELSEQGTLCLTLDFICEGLEIDSVDLLHIDTEGAEYEVIKGIGNIKPKMIFAEFLIDGGWNGQKSFKETLDLLDSLGYNVVKEMGHDKLFVRR